MAANPAFAATKSLVQHIQNCNDFDIDGKKPSPTACKDAAAVIIGDVIVELMDSKNGQELRAKVANVIAKTEEEQAKIKADRTKQRKKDTQKKEPAKKTAKKTAKKETDPADEITVD